ncbi:MAG TPA: DUF3105 domain-containing protein [Miltoncostaeaceae bacterium]|nr:DUF3105 domain-containing protein [Miltoncostaeaceae bacterium]
MRMTVRSTAAVVTIGAVAAAAGCGGGSGGAGGGVAPVIDPGVAAAAEGAGCRVASYPPAQGPVAADGDGAAQPVPPVQGPHREWWADWGVYDVAVPETYLIHNMSHGGIVVRVGPGVRANARRSLVDAWRADPDLVLVEPGGAGVPGGGLVVTTWLRAMRCPSVTPAAVTAVAAFRDAFRGHGLHPQAGNYAGPEPAPADLPDPTIAEPGI